VRIILISLMLVACGSPVVVKLPLPVRPLMPTVSSAELQCLSDDAFESLRKRDILWEGHVNKLEGVIRSTRQ